MSSGDMGPKGKRMGAFKAPARSGCIVLRRKEGASWWEQPQLLMVALCTAQKLVGFPSLESVLTWGYGSHKVFVLSGFEDGQQAGGRAEMGTDAFYLVFGKSNTFPPVPCVG